MNVRTIISMRFFSPRRRYRNVQSRKKCQPVRKTCEISLCGHCGVIQGKWIPDDAVVEKEEKKGNRCSRFWKALTIGGVLEEENSPSERVMIGKAAERSGVKRAESRINE